MSSIPISSRDYTPKDYQDFSKPLVMSQGETLFKKLTTGFNTNETITYMKDITSVLLATKTSSLEDENYWASVEKTLNKGKSISTKAKDVAGEINVLLSTFYGAINELDKKSENILEVNELQDAYYQARNHIQTKISRGLEGQPLRILKRVISTLDNRFDNVITSFNERVDNQEIAGPKIQSLFATE